MVLGSAVPGFYVSVERRRVTSTAAAAFPFASLDQRTATRHPNARRCLGSNRAGRRRPQEASHRPGTVRSATARASSCDGRGSHLRRVRCRDARIRPTERRHSSGSIPVRSETVRAPSIGTVGDMPKALRVRHSRRIPEVADLRLVPVHARRAGRARTDRPCEHRGTAIPLARHHAARANRAASRHAASVRRGH